VSALAAVVGQLGDYRRLLRIRDYRLLWTAQLVSTFGDRLTQLALAALVYSITGSEIGMGIMLTVSEAPRAVLGLLAGTVADRVSRKTLLVAMDSSRAVIVFILGLWVGVPLSVVYLLTALHATASVFFSPTRYAVVPDIVPRHKLLDANTLDETTQGALDPLAYLAGGALVAGLGVRLAFGLDSLTFLLSAGLIALTTQRTAAMWRADRDEPKPLHVEVAEGARVLFADRVLRANTLLMATASLIASADTILIYILAFTHWETGALGLGFMEGGLAVGFVIGALLCGAVVRWLGKGTTILVGLVGTGASMLLVSFLPFWPATIVYAASGILNMLFFVPGVTLVQEKAPRKVLGRVLSTRGALLSIASFVSYGMATLLTTVVPAQTLMAALGTVLTLLTLVAATSASLRAR
jgi:MFS transporter, DHA3 family, macrolide efflux protein